MTLQAKESGWIEVICGPMFSGKTEELIRRLRRAEIARHTVRVIKPCLDDRFASDAIVSHSSHHLKALSVSSSCEILNVMDGTEQVVGIDEAQFFDSGLPEVVETLAERGCRVIVSGLDTDYRSRPFEAVSELMARAEYVTKLLAICSRCGHLANRSLRIRDSGQRIQIGASEEYQAVCRRCYHQAHQLHERNDHEYD